MNPISRRSVLAGLVATAFLPLPAAAATHVFARTDRRRSNANIDAWLHPSGSHLCTPAAMSGERGSLVALSFDDGPDPLYTGRIARTLADHGVQATFFLIGRSVSAFPEVVREVAAMGHEIGAHSQTHPVMTKLSPSALATEMRACSAALASVVPDARVRWFRPPYGECNSAVVAAAAARGLDTVRWDIDPRDWSPKQSADAIANDIVTGLHPGAVALMHSINARSEAAVPAILRRGQEAGYQFVTVSRWWDAATKAAASHPA